MSATSEGGALKLVGGLSEEVTCKLGSLKDAWRELCKDLRVAQAEAKCKGPEEGCAGLLEVARRPG